MKKILLSTFAIGALFAANTNSDLDLKTKVNKLEKEVAQLKTMLNRTKNKVNPIASNDHIYWGFDLRSSVDFIQYKLSNGDKKANNILSNKILLKGLYKPSDDLKVNFVLQANNIYGMNGNNNPQTLANDNSGWTANETPDDSNVRVKEAFFNYWFGDENQFMFSAGRRPATNGYPANLREGDRAESPIAHLVNMEFDGVSFLIKNEALPEAFEDYGTSLKFCAGRGYSPNSGKFSPYPYDKDGNLKINDFAGFILIPYDDGQYALWTETIKAWNVKGLYDTNGDGIPDTMKDGGGYFGFNALLKADGIGDGISDFLDDTKAFLSFAMSQTSPNSNGELGTTDDKTGTSFWIGADMPANEDGDARFGLNFVHGSKYFRSMTYGEDTLIGSIAATRGNAFDVYYIKTLIPNLTASLRATYIKYDYTGSNAFFGEAGTPVDVDNAPTSIEKATDIRAYIRYNF